MRYNRDVEEGAIIKSKISTTAQGGRNTLSHFFYFSPFQALTVASCRLWQSAYFPAISMYESIRASTESSIGSDTGWQGAASAESRAGMVGCINCGFDDAHPVRAETASIRQRIGLFGIG